MRPALLPAILAAAVAAACASDPPTTPSVTPTPGPSPVAAATPVPTPTPPAPNQAPVLDVRVSPRPVTGSPPFAITVDMCRTSDPEGDELRFAFEFEGEGKTLVSECRAAHTYDRPWSGQAYFCATDGDPEHLVCRIVAVSVS